MLALPFGQAGLRGLVLHHHGVALRHVVVDGVGVAHLLSLVFVVLHFSREALDRHLDLLLVDWHRSLLLVHGLPSSTLLLRQKLRREGALAHLLALLIAHKLLGFFELLLVFLVQDLIALLWRRLSRLFGYLHASLVDRRLEAAVLEFNLPLRLLV